MKKFRHYALLLVTAMAVFGCSKDYDDTELKQDISDLQSRVEKLETWCTTVNGQISALQELVTALEANDYVTGVSPVTNGYTIHFSKGESITIYNGKDGAKGTDGVTPVIGVDKFEGEYYWTVKIGTAAATWMLDANNNKIRTTGDKGADGSAGVAGTSPVLSVATDTDGKVYWKVNGEWLLNSGKKVQATGDKGDKGETGSTGAAGADGAQGDAVFAADGVTVDKTKGTVTFTLAGEDATTFTLPMASEMKIFDKFDEFKVNSEKHELALALNVKDGEYAAIKAELTSSKGMEVAMVKATTRAASTPWGVELTSPTFKEDKTIDVNAKVTFVLPAGIEEGEFALLKVTVVGKDGTEHSATRVIVYTTEVSVESVTLADKSVPEGSRVKLIPTFTPANATNQNVTWTSSELGVATIAADGTVTGVAQGGTTIITVTTEDGGFTATCTVTVTEKLKGYGWYLAGKESGNFEISTLEELKQFGLLVNGDRSALTFNGLSAAAVDFSGKTITLKDNINLNNEEWTPIGTSSSNPFKGTFDGNGKTISGLKVSGVYYAGFLGYIKEATVKNFEVAGGTVSSDASGGCVGGIVGCSSSSIVENCSSSAIVSGQTVGGVVGWAPRSTVKACHASGNVTAIEDSSDIIAAGGVVGYISISGSIQACYYSTGIVTGGKGISGNYSCAGGVIGSSSYGVKVYNCYSTGTVIAGTSTGGRVYTGAVIGYADDGNNNGSLLYVTSKGANRGIGEKSSDDASKVKSITSESDLSANISFLNTGLPGEVGYQFKADGTLEKVQ